MSNTKGRYTTSVGSIQRGKRLALEGRSGDILTAHFALASAGLGFKDVQVHDLPQANGVQAFLAGKIDAIDSRTT